MLSAGANPTGAGRSLSPGRAQTGRQASPLRGASTNRPVADNTGNGTMRPVNP